MDMPPPTPQPTQTKRPYQSPKLMVYGTVREVTANTSNTVTHHADGGILFFTKTG
jgi:hypothetical protein